MIASYSAAITPICSRSQTHCNNDDEDESTNSEIDYYFAQREFAEEQGITGMMKTSTTNEELEKKMREMQEQIQREKEEK